MTIRLVHLPEENPYGALLARMAAISKDQRVLVVEVRKPGGPLRRRLEEAEANLDHIHILDATGTSGSSVPEQNVTLVDGPHLLELIEKRTQQLLRHKIEGDSTVVLDDVYGFSDHAGEGALLEITKRAIHLHDSHHVQEFVIHPRTSSSLLDKLRTIIHEEMTIGADGRPLDIPSPATL